MGAPTPLPTPQSRALLVRKHPLPRCFYQGRMLGPLGWTTTVHEKRVGGQCGQKSSDYQGQIGMLLPRGAGRSASNMKNYHQTPVINSQDHRGPRPLGKESLGPRKRGPKACGAGAGGSWAPGPLTAQGLRVFMANYTDTSLYPAVAPFPLLFLISRKAPWCAEVHNPALR